MPDFPEFVLCESIHWTWFATLTLPDSMQLVTSERLGQVARAWLRRVAKHHGKRFEKLLWCTREEYGRRGRRHLHALVGGFEDDRFKRWFAKQDWERITGAMARVSKYDATLPGVAYILKGGTAYETSKFVSGASDLVLSHSVYNVAGSKLNSYTPDAQVPRGT